MQALVTNARCIAARALATLALAALAPAGLALTEGRTADGNRYVAGGIGLDEVETLQQQAPSFALQVVTAAPGGAYLAGTHIRIEGPGNALVLDTTVHAPWLLVDVPSGRYTVRATHSGQTVERKATVTEGRTQRLVLHFDVAVDNEGTALRGR